MLARGYFFKRQWEKLKSKRKAGNSCKLSIGSSETKAQISFIAQIAVDKETMNHLFQIQSHKGLISN